MACILEELEKTLTKQLGNTKNSKEFKEGAAKAKERVAELSTLLNNVVDMKKAVKSNAQNKVESIEETEKSTIEIAKELYAKKHKNFAYGKEVEKLSSVELQDLAKDVKDNGVHSHIIGSKEQDKIMYIKFQQVKKAEKESIDNLLNIPEVKELIDTKKVNSYSAYMVSLVDSIKKPNASYSDTVAFSGDMVKALINGVVNVSGGSTDKNNNVKIATDKVPDSEVHRISVDWYLEGTEEGKRIMEMNEDDYNKAMLNNESLDRFVDSKKQELALNLLDAVKNLNGVHSLTHEMIHVGSAAFMKENPEHPATKKVMALYIEALENKDWISRAVGSSYWTENVDEFLAESLSNPLMVKYLNTMTTRHGESVISKSFSTLIDTVLGMLGFKKTDSVYQHVLDGFTAMMEYQYGQMTEETNAKPSTVQDIIQAELDKVREKMLAEHRNGFTYKYPEIELEENYKVEADIIVPTETFEQNVNRKIECKE